jgi:hypothetical protein
MSVWMKIKARSSKANIIFVIWFSGYGCLIISLFFQNTWYKYLYYIKYVKTMNNWWHGEQWSTVELHEKTVEHFVAEWRPFQACIYAYIKWMNIEMNCESLT